MKKTCVVYPAKKIITMFPEQAYAQAVAVMDGKILGVGEMNALVEDINSSKIAQCEINNIFKDKVIMPGLIEAHTHLVVPAFEYSHHFVSQVPWPKPEGGFNATFATKEEVIAELHRLDAILPAGELLWGTHYDNNLIGNLHKNELDAVSTTRPILISNMVFHRFWCNSHLLNIAGVSRDNISKGVEVDTHGDPTGTLTEGTGFSIAFNALPAIISLTLEKIRYILPLFRAQGVTTITEMVMGARGGFDREYALFDQIFRKENHGLRCLGFPHMNRLSKSENSFDAALEKVIHHMQFNDDNFIINAMKLYHDGSIISHTSPLEWPGYWDGTPNGHMEYSAEIIHEYILKLHARGLPVAVHTNSQLGIENVLNAINEALVTHNYPNIRHRLEHCYTITSAQLLRAKKLGVGVQFFCPQIYYYGDSHLKILGQTRADNITPTGTADRLGVSWGMHSDPPGTPPLSWMAIWSAVTRQTISGRVLGKNQRVSVEAALHAFTLEHARQLHIDHLVGSIEFGKKADFCILEKDPLSIPVDELKDIPVWGTVMNGELYPI